MTYSEAIDYLYSSLPVYQHIGPGAYKPGLGNSLALDALFGHPHRSYPTIHIAGTNGKGSTAHTLAAILQSAGYKVGLYTSPHIYDFGERIRVDGKMISHESVTSFVEEWVRNVGTRRAACQNLQPSFFELTSTMAFRYFADEKVDVAVIETGLGGRLDSTNIITPVLSVITNISLDHTALLGDTPAQIAAEKAGIIKPGVPVVIGEPAPDTLPVFEAKAAEAGAPLYCAAPLEAVLTDGPNIYPSTPFGPLEGELRGEHQALNAATVLKAAELLRGRFAIPDSAVSAGMANVTSLTGLFGRWSRIMSDPETVADTGHNQGGWQRIAAALNRLLDSRRKALVIGFVADKDLTHIFDYIKSVEGDVAIWFAAPTAPRGLKAEALAAAALEAGIEGTVEPDVNAALAAARAWAGAEGFVLVAGSNFLISDLHRSW